MADAGKVTILNVTGPGSTPQEPLALVAKMVDFVYVPFKLEPKERGRLASVAESSYAPFEPEWRGGRFAPQLEGRDEPVRTPVRTAEGNFATQRRGGLASAREALYAPRLEGRGGSLRTAEEFLATVRRGGLASARGALFAPVEPERRGGLFVPQLEGRRGPVRTAEEYFATARRGGLGEELYAPFEPEWRDGPVRAAEAWYAPLEPQGRGGLASAAESDTALPEIRYRTSFQDSPTILFITS